MVLPKVSFLPSPSFKSVNNIFTWRLPLLQLTSQTILLTSRIPPSVVIVISLPRGPISTLNAEWTRIKITISHNQLQFLRSPLGQITPDSVIIQAVVSRTSFDFLLSSTVRLCVHAKSFSRVWLCVTLWAVTHQVPLFMKFSRQEY